MCPLVSRIARQDRNATTLEGLLDLLPAAAASKHHAPGLMQADGRHVLGEAARLIDVARDALFAAVFVDDDLIGQVLHQPFVHEPPAQFPCPLGQLAKTHRLVDPALLVVVAPAVVLYAALKLRAPLGSVDASQQLRLLFLRDEIRFVHKSRNFVLRLATGSLRRVGNHAGLGCQPTAKLVGVEPLVDVDAPRPSKAPLTFDDQSVAIDGQVSTAGSLHAPFREGTPSLDACPTQSIGQVQGRPADGVVGQVGAVPLGAGVPRLANDRAAAPGQGETPVLARPFKGRPLRGRQRSRVAAWPGSCQGAGREKLLQRGVAPEPLVERPIAMAPAAQGGGSPPHRRR